MIYINCKFSKVLFVVSKCLCTGLIWMLVANVLIGYSYADNYNYPINDPIAATVIGTPAEYEVKYNDILPLKSLKIKVFENRVTPKYFWYNDKVTYGLLKQKKSHLLFM